MKWVSWQSIDSKWNLFPWQIKAIHPIAQEVNEKMIRYIEQEIARSDFDGLDAKDVICLTSSPYVSS